MESGLDEKRRKQQVLQHGITSRTELSEAPPIINDVLRTPGETLDQETRAFMEPRFGHDFSKVRVHSDSKAAESARAVNALAFTVGRDIVFGAGRYAPGTSAGQQLLAHELTHVLQQRSGVLQSKVEIGPPDDAYEQEANWLSNAVMQPESAGLRPHAATPLYAPVVQRTCTDAALGAPAPDCTRKTGDVPGEVFYFVVDCDDLQSGEDKHLECFAAGLPPGTVLKIHGFASTDGDAAYNWRLSCHRANKVSSLLLSFRPDLTVTSPNFKHGPTPGPAAYRRSVTVETIMPKAGPAPQGICGPEVTDWFVRQVNAAMKDAAVLVIQAHMSAADVIARTHGTTAREVAEGGAAGAVVAQMGKMTAAKTPPPPPTPAASSQIAAGTASGLSAASSLVAHPFDAATIATHVNEAAQGWKKLVNHGARYDFKAHTMKGPRTSCCPLDPCTDTITLCVGSAPENCYLTDLPGNLFYALIGRFVGFSELTLQLGSQFAQLTGTGTWDPPEDTAAIHLGFGLPLPLSASGLCRLLPPARGSLTAKTGCIDCRQPTTAAIK